MPADLAVLWSERLQGRGHVFARLHGVDLPGERAWISMSNTNQVPRQPDMFWELVEVDLGSGRTVQRWRETVGGSDEARRNEFGMVWPLVDSEADVARLIEIALRTETTSGVWGAPVVVSPDGEIGVHHRWGDDKHMGDWLIMRDRAGKNPSRLDEGFVAAYAPAFSPDGTQIAFTACKMKRGEGCVYGTYITTLGGRTQKIDGLEHANHLEWSADGSTIYVIDTAGRWPFAARYRLGESEAERILDEPLRSMALAESPSGAMLVVSGYSGEPGKQTAQYVWYSAPSLEPVAQYELYLGTGLEAVRDDGVALVHGRIGMLAVDPFGGREGAVSGLYQGARASRWDRSGHIIMGHSRFDPDRTSTFELVRVNPDAMLTDELGSN